MTQETSNFLSGMALSSPFLVLAWVVAYDRGDKHERERQAFREKRNRPSPIPLSTEEFDAAVKRDELMHVTDPACSFGCTRFEHDVMGMCPCV